MERGACAGWLDNRDDGRAHIKPVITMRNEGSDVTRALAFFVTVFLVSVAIAQDTGSHRVKVMLVNQESSLHTSVSNQDGYRLRITPRRGAAFDAIAVDSYPGYAAALPIQRLNKSSIFSIKLTRTPYCDQPSDTSTPPCFAMEHGSWTLPRGASTEETWWT